MATDWSAIEKALWDWVKAGSALADGSIIWAHQDGPIPATPYILLAFGEMLPLGAFDEVVTSDADDPEPGADLNLTVRGQREFAVKLEAFTGDVVGTSSPRALLSVVQAALALPSIGDIFQTAGISMFERGTITYVPAIRRAAFEARAHLEVRFYCTEEISELSTWIETVTATSYLGPPDEGTTDEIDI